MNYSRWATVEELKEKLTKVSVKGKVEKSGIPMLGDDDNLYVKDDEAHSMIIGSQGSGKTQTTVLPTLRLAIKSEESFVLNDANGEIYELLKDELKKANYNTVVINLADADNSDKFNPISLPEKLYKEGNKDAATDILEDIGNYIFCSDTYNPNVDPFWKNSSISFLTAFKLPCIIILLPPPLPLRAPFIIFANPGRSVYSPLYSMPLSSFTPIIYLYPLSSSPINPIIAASVIFRPSFIRLRIMTSSKFAEKTGIGLSSFLLSSFFLRLSRTIDVSSFFNLTLSSDRVLFLFMICSTPFAPSRRFVESHAIYCLLASSRYT